MDFQRALHQEIEGRQRDRVMLRYHLRYLFNLRLLFGEEESADVQVPPEEDWVEVYAWDFAWSDEEAHPLPAEYSDANSEEESSDDGIDRDWWSRVESTPSPPPLSPWDSVAPEDWDSWEWGDLLVRERMDDDPDPHQEWPYMYDSGAEELE